MKIPAGGCVMICGPFTQGCQVEPRVTHIFRHLLETGRRKYFFFSCKISTNSWLRLMHLKYMQAKDPALGSVHSCVTWLSTTPHHTTHTHKNTEGFRFYFYLRYRALVWIRLVFQSIFFPSCCSSSAQAKSEMTIRAKMFLFTSQLVAAAKKKWLHLQWSGGVNESVWRRRVREGRNRRVSKAFFFPRPVSQSRQRRRGPRIVSRAVKSTLAFIYIFLLTSLNRALSFS